MQLANHPTETKKKMSPAINAALVDSLFMNPAPMVFGAFGPAIAGSLIAAVTGDILSWLCVPLFIVVGVARALQMYRYKQRNAPLTTTEAVIWEERYKLGAFAYGIVLGLWVCVVLLRTSDPAAHMLCITTVVAYTSAGVGRTFGRPRIFHVMLVLACGPLIATLMFVGGVYHVAMALLSLVFFVALRSITTSLQRIYINAWIAREREAALAGQFDTALNNMPHGLCMFTADGRLAVMNHRFSSMMHLPDDLMHSRAGASDVVDACVGAGSVSAASGKIILAEIENSQAKDIITTDPDVARGRSLSWTFQPMAGGGAVVLLEDITERRNAEARITHLARFDELTGLPNRVNFRDEIEHLLAAPHNGEQLSALLFVDLDQFKQVNDTLGHPCGDQLLCAVAERLRAMLRPEDFVARFGGDEFVIVVQGMRTTSDLTAFAERIVTGLREPLRIGDEEIATTVSIGIAVTSMSDHLPADLIREADLALYRAKGSGRDRHEVYGEALQVRAIERLETERLLRRAITDKRLVIEYQPIIDLATGMAVEAEALLRVDDSDRGLLLPAEFLSVAEECGLLPAMDDWMRTSALTQFSAWRSNPALSAIGCIAVNATARELVNGEFASVLADRLRETELEGRHLAIEVTEHVLLQTSNSAMTSLADLRSLGVHIGLDDFGMGYSALSYLQAYPLDYLKIDRSFIERMGSDRRSSSIIAAMIQLAHAMDLVVVAEGIETQDQLSKLRALGCDRGQGYVFSRPVGAVAFAQYLQAQAA